MAVVADDAPQESPQPNPGVNPSGADPPAYGEDSTVPSYEQVEAEEAAAAPIFLTYRLRKYARKHFEFSPIGTETRGLYVVRTQDMTWISSNKQDVIFGRAANDMPASLACLQLSTARFLRSGDLPWKPRVRIHYGPDDLDMTMEPGTEWTFQQDGKRRYWRRNPHPWRLDLFEDEAPGFVRRKASFVYTASGTRANNGRAVGTVRIFCGNRVLQQDLVERMLCALATVVVYWRDQGKLLVNEGEA